MMVHALGSAKWFSIALIFAVQIACSPDNLPGNNTELADLYIDDFYLDQTFQSNQYDYSASVGYLGNSIRIHAIAEDSTSSVTINDKSTDSEGSRVSLFEGNNAFSIVVTAANGDQQTYSLEVTRATYASLANTAYVKSFNTQDGDRLGYSVAIDADFAAAGAPYEDTGAGGINNVYDENAAEAGAVYVYSYYFGSWVPEAFIKSDAPNTSDLFGYTVAMSGNTLVVGAPGDSSNSSGINNPRNIDVNAALSGAVYVFVRDEIGYWSQQAYIKASNPDGGDFFGLSVAIDGDTIVVGASSEDGNNSGVNSTPNDDGNADSSGAAYVFVRDENGTWNQQAYLKPETVEAGSVFSIVDISGDTIAVGAVYADTSIVNSGAVYLFERNADQEWVQVDRVQANNPGDTDGFGISLSLHEDTLAVGAPLEDSVSYGINSAPNDTATDNEVGAVYVFEKNNDGQWQQHAYIKAAQTGTTNIDDWFGYSVALHGNQLLVGAQREDSDTTGFGLSANLAASATDVSAGYDAGAAYTFKRDVAGIWSEDLYIKHPDTSNGGDRLGWSVDTSGDRFIIGAYREDGAGYGINDVYFDDDSTDDAGAAFIFQ